MKWNENDIHFIQDVFNVVRVKFTEHKQCNINWRDVQTKNVVNNVDM